MAGIRILSVAFSEPNMQDAFWVRVLSIVEGLSKRGCKIKLVSYVPRSRFHHSIINLDGCNCEVISCSRTSLPRIFMNTLKGYNPHLVYANGYLSAFISILAKLRSTPIVFDMHGLMIDEYKMLHAYADPCRSGRILFYSFMEPLALALSNKILCASRHLTYYLSQAKKVHPDKIEYVTNGVDLNLYKPLTEGHVSDLREKLGLEDKFVFGYIGRFQKWQGAKKFLEAARLVKDNKLGFLIVGGNDAWVKRNVVKLKKVSRQQLPYYYSACDVLVLPRPHHIVTEVAAPTKFAEYAAMGKPLLVTNVGDAAMFVKRYKCGIVIHNNNPRNLKEGFRAFRELSEGELQRMGENSRRLAEEEFDWNKILAKLDLTFTKLVKQ